MAEHNQHQQQALAYLQQDQAVSRHQLRQVSEHQAPQVALAEAALEAYLLNRQQQEALVALQYLERERLGR